MQEKRDVSCQQINGVCIHWTILSDSPPERRGCTVCTTQSVWTCAECFCRHRQLRERDHPHVVMVAPARAAGVSVLEHASTVSDTATRKKTLQCNMQSFLICYSRTSSVIDQGGSQTPADRAARMRPVRQFPGRWLALCPESLACSVAPEYFRW
jgi:hypothetical protein